MRIACLITVCAALLPTIHGLEHSRSRRRQESRSHQPDLQRRNAYVSNGTEPSSLRPTGSSAAWRPQSSSRAQYNHRDPRGTRWTHPPGPRQNFKRSYRGRSRRQLRTKTIELGRSYDVNENHIETIQAPELFEDGAIHIEPVYRVTKKKTILDQFVDLIHRAIEPPKSHLGPLVGPFNFPGVGDKIYVRLLEPLNSNRLVVRLVTHVPVPEIETSFDHFSAGKALETPDLSSSTQHLVSEAFASSSNQRRHVHSGAVATGGLHASSSNVVKVSKPLNLGKLDGTRFPGVSLKDGHNAGLYRVNFKYGDTRYNFSPSKSGVRTLGHQYTGGQYAGGSQVYKYIPGKVVKGSNASEEGHQVASKPKFQEASFYSYYSNPYEHQFASTSVNTLNVEDSEARESLNPVLVATADSIAASKVTRNSRVVPAESPSLNFHSETETAFQIVSPPTLSLATAAPPVKVLNYIYTNGSAESWKPYASNAVSDGGSHELNRTMNGGFKPVNPGQNFKPSASASENNNWEPVRSRSLAIESLNLAANIRSNKINKDTKFPEAFFKVSNSKQSPRKPESQPVSAVTQDSSRVEKKLDKPGAQQSRKKSFEYEEYEYIGEPIYIEYYEDKIPSNATQSPTSNPSTLKTTTSPTSTSPRSAVSIPEATTSTTITPAPASTTKAVKYSSTRVTTAFNSFGKNSVTSSTTKPITNRTTKLVVSTTTRKPSSTTRRMTFAGTTKKPIVSTPKKLISSSTESPVISTTKRWAQPVMLFSTVKKFSISTTTRKPFSTTVKKQTVSSTTAKPSSVTIKKLTFSSTTRKPTILYPTKRPIFNSTRALALKSRYMNRQIETKNANSTTPKTV